MCEIFLMYFACKSLGDMLRAKRRDPVLLQVALVVCWIGGEVMAAGQPRRCPHCQSTFVVPNLS